MLRTILITVTVMLANSVSYAQTSWCSGSNCGGPRPAWCDGVTCASQVTGHMQEQAKALDLIIKWQTAKSELRAYRNSCRDQGCQMMIDQAIKESVPRICGSFPQGDRECRP